MILVSDDRVLGSNNLDKLIALVVHFLGRGAQALCPLGQSDLVIIVRVAAVQEIGDARFHREQRSS